MVETLSPSISLSWPRPSGESGARGLLFRLSRFDRRSGFRIFFVFFRHARYTRSRRNGIGPNRNGGSKPMSLESPDLRTFATVAIFVATYAGVALGRVPGLRIDRAGISLVGASLMIAFGTLSLE